jgi:uncharacterized membrane protein
MADISTILTVVLGVATLGGMTAMAFYAIQLLRSLRSGVLEKGWKFIALASFCLIFGTVSLDLSISGLNLSSLLEEMLGYSGAALQAIGVISIAYGFKAQNDAWKPKGMRKTPGIMKQAPV